MKNYRIVRLAGLHYQHTVQSFLGKIPDFSQKSYDNQLKYLFQDSPIYSDGFSRSFHHLGQEAFELIFDFEILQKQWAKENGIQYTPENWMFEIIMAQIAALKPDVIFFQGTELAIPGRFVKGRESFTLPEILIEKFPFIRLVVMFSGYPCMADRIKGVNILFACVPSLVKFYLKMGFDPILLYHSFDESIINKLNVRDKQYGFTFTGSSRASESRYWALRQLMEETNLEIWLYENLLHQRNSLKRVLHSFMINSIVVINPKIMEKYEYSDFLPQWLQNIFKKKVNEAYIGNMVHIRKEPIKYFREDYPDRCHIPMMGIDMYNLLHQSIITFNKHTDAAKGDVGNMRMFEATGVGTCLLTDTGRNISDLFEEDKEVVTYRTIDEAVEKVNYLLDHPDEAEKIAKAGQARTLKDHTIMNRCQQIDEVIQANL